MEEAVCELFKEFALALRFKWGGMNPEYKLVWKALGALFALVAFAGIVTGLALLIGPR